MNLVVMIPPKQEPFNDEETMTARAELSAKGAAQGLNGVFSSESAASVLEHYRERMLE